MTSLEASVPHIRACNECEHYTYETSDYLRKIDKSGPGCVLTPAPTLRDVKFTPLPWEDNDPAPRCPNFEQVTEKLCLKCGTPTKNRYFGTVMCDECVRFRLSIAVKEYLKKAAGIYWRMKRYLDPSIRRMTEKHAIFIVNELEGMGVKIPKERVSRRSIWQYLRSQGVTEISAAAAIAIQHQLKP